MDNICILPEDGSFLEKATKLAKEIGLPLVSEAKEAADFFVIVGTKGIGLKKSESKDLPVYVDFNSEEMNYRRKKGGGKNQDLAKAVGLKNLKNPHVIDATAGLGRDAFILASLGAQVEMVERNKVIHAMLSDGIARACEVADISEIVGRLSLYSGDAYEFLKNYNGKADVVYLDPMFPHREKSALVKKEMQTFQKIIGEDLDADKLLEAAIAKAKYRVVIKRPRLAPSLADKEPDFSITGKANRFDVYVNMGIGK